MRSRQGGAHVQNLDTGAHLLLVSRCGRASLDDINLSFPEGWTGIVGANGCGKTTLVHIACGILRPDAGSVTPPLSASFCPQDASREPASLYDFACDYSPTVLRLRRELGIADEMPWRFSELSAGEQKKIQIAVALWASSDVLVIDEPTNHVDAACRSQLAHVLGAYKGIGLLVSHDRELLDALAGQCVSFENGSVLMRPGSYSAGHEQALLEERACAREREHAKSELERLKAEQHRRRMLADRSSARRSARSLDKNDSSGREKIRLAVYTGQDGKSPGLAARMDARVEEARGRLGGMRVRKRYEGDLWLDASPSRRRVLLRIPETELPCGPGRTLKVPELHLGRDDHVGISGPNGSGKSTLVRHMMGLLDAEGSTKVLYIPQELRRDEEESIRSEVRGLSPSDMGRLLSAVVQFDSDPERMRDEESVSPGELRKLALALGAMRRPKLIVLDEPTNHLDIHSVEALERALSSFSGALVLVSHDARFLQATTTLFLQIEQSGICRVLR